MRVALPSYFAPSWTAGAVFTEMVVRSLRRVGGDDLDIHVFCKTSAEHDRWDGLAKAVRTPQDRFTDRVYRQLGIPIANPVERYCKAELVDALLLHQSLNGRRLPFVRLPWIPDYQHHHLPDFFTADEIAVRNRAQGRCVTLGDRVICSSQAVQTDFCGIYPAYSDKARVLRFPSLYSFLPPVGPPKLTAAAYGLPDKFLLVANQYWSHKNHQVVIDAISLLAQRGVQIPVAFTGAPVDYRDPINRNVSSMLQAIAQAGLAGRIIPLGLVPKAHLTDLMRLAAAVVQPSRFEGWSTVVQDARALGRPVICSDIPVHREQAPDAVGRFGCDDPEGLADLLEQNWDALAEGPDPTAEADGIAREQTLAQQHGEGLLALCQGR